MILMWPVSKGQHKWVGIHTKDSLKTLQFTDSYILMVDDDILCSSPYDTSELFSHLETSLIYLQKSKQLRLGLSQRARLSGPPCRGAGGDGTLCIRTPLRAFDICSSRSLSQLLIDMLSFSLQKSLNYNLTHTTLCAVLGWARSLSSLGRLSLKQFGFIPEWHPTLLLTSVRGTTQTVLQDR